MSGVLVVAEHRRGELSPTVFELITAAQELRSGAGGNVSVLVMAQDPGAYAGQLGVSGVDEVIAMKVGVAEFQPDVYEAALGAAIAERQPSVVLLAHSVNSWGYAPYIAVKGGYGLATDVSAIGYEDGELIATRSGHKEKVSVELDFPGKSTVVLTVRGNTYAPAAEAGSPASAELSAPEFQPRSTHKQFIEAAGDADVDIAGERFLLSIGRGIAEEDNVEIFRELADELGATLSCSRPIADSGWLPKSRQVGYSGKTASECKLYIAMGISGSIQHLHGMKHVETIIAVNSDPEAPIFSVARYGVVGDIFEIEKELRSRVSG